VNQPEIMSQEEQELTRIDAALEIVKARHPEFVADEQTLLAMASVVRAENLNGYDADALTYAYVKVRPVPAQIPATDVEPTDPIESEARRLIRSGEVTVARVQALSSEEFARKCQNLAFTKALDHLEKPALPQPTRGDLQIAYGRARRNGTELTHEIVRAVAESQDAIASGFAEYVPASARPAVNPHYASPLSRTNAPTAPRRSKLAADEARANEAANAQRVGRGMKSLSVHERQRRLFLQTCIGSIGK